MNHHFCQNWKPLSRLWTVEQKKVFSDFHNLFKLFRHIYENKNPIELTIQQMCSLIQSLSFSNLTEIDSYIKFVSSIPENIAPHETVGKTKKILNEAKEEYQDFSNSLRKLKPPTLEKVTNFSFEEVKQENTRPYVKLSSSLGKVSISLDLGFSLDGVPQCFNSPPYITFENCEKENLMFKFSLPLFCKISQAYGKIKPNKQITIYFEPMNDFEKRDSRIKDVITMSVSGESFTLIIEVVLSRHVEELKLDKIFPESQNREEAREINFEDIIPRTQSSKKIGIRNPYPVPLRMKIENFTTEVTFDKNDEDVVLGPF